MPKSTQAPLPLAPPNARAEVLTAAAHALCREHRNPHETPNSARDTLITINVLSRYAPQSNGQRMGVRLARRVIHDIRHRSGPRGNPGMDGVRRPSLTDFIIVELTRFRGDLSSWRGGGGVHDAEVETAVPGGNPTADGRAGSVRT